MNIYAFVIFSKFGYDLSLNQQQANKFRFPQTQTVSLKTFSKLKNTSKTGKTIEDIHGDISIKNVHFSYPTRSDVAVFKVFYKCVFLMKIQYYVFNQFFYSFINYNISKVTVNNCRYVP